MDVPLCSLLRSHPGLVEEDRKNEFMFGLVMEAIPELGARDFLRRRIEAFGMIYSEKKRNRGYGVSEHKTVLNPASCLGNPHSQLFLSFRKSSINHNKGIEI